MTATSRTAEIRRLAASDESAAEAALAALFADLFGLAAVGVAINRDRYSLNSLNGFFSAGGSAAGSARGTRASARRTRSSSPAPTSPPSSTSRPSAR